MLIREPALQCTSTRYAFYLFLLGSHFSIVTISDWVTGSANRQTGSDARVWAGEKCQIAAAAWDGDQVIMSTRCIKRMGYT